MLRKEFPLALTFHSLSHTHLIKKKRNLSGPMIRRGQIAGAARDGLKACVGVHTEVATLYDPNTWRVPLTTAGKLPALQRWMGLGVCVCVHTS